MKNKLLLIASLLIATLSQTNAQVKIGNNPNSINAASLLELESTSSGLLIPRMTLAQKNAIASPPTALLIFQTDGILGFYYYDGSSWQLVGPGSGNYWNKTGNDIYNNNSGNVAVGTSTFDGTNPEKFLVDAGVTSSVNAIYAKGTIDNYMQFNIQNLSSGHHASSDVVATADNGTESVNYIDMGINGSAYTDTMVGNANDGYLFSSGNNFNIGNVTPGKDVVFFSNGYNTPTHERMRMTSSGYVGIGISTPQAYLHIHNPTTGAGSYPLLQLTTGFTGSASTDGFTIGLENNGGNDNIQFKQKETGNFEFYGGGSEAMYIKNTGNVGIGNAASSPNSTLQLGGSMSTPVTTQTGATYSASSTDFTIFCNHAGSTMTLTLPDATSTAGRIYIVKNLNTTQDVTVNTTGGQKIDGSNTKTVVAFQAGQLQQNCVWFQSNGANWYIISDH